MHGYLDLVDGNTLDVGHPSSDNEMEKYVTIFEYD